MFDESIAKLDIWFLLLGLPAQLALSARFLVQWIVSERKKACVVPVASWHSSVAGGLGLLVYGIIRCEPVLILGNAMGSFVNTRNLMMIKQPGTLT